MEPSSGTNSGGRTELGEVQVSLPNCLLAGCLLALPAACAQRRPCAAWTADLLAGWTCAPTACRIAPPRALPDSSLLRALAAGDSQARIRVRDGIRRRRSRGTERAMAATGASGVGKARAELDGWAQLRSCFLWSPWIQFSYPVSAPLPRLNLKSERLPVPALIFFWQSSSPIGPKGSP